jgi:ABC-type multidrug transport system permease subunit
MNRFHPLGQLFLARLREFYREPEALFWVYGFPLLLAIGLGVAFMSREPEAPIVDVQSSTDPAAEAGALAQQLRADGIKVAEHDATECLQRYRTGKTSLYIVPSAGGVEYHYDPAREESVLARYRVETVIQRWKAGIELDSSNQPNPEKEWHAPTATWKTSEQLAREPGNRYIDFLMPGLMGMNLMGGGLWGVGFVIVDMRVRKLLKRLLATPMSRGQFLMAILCARLVFMFPDMLLLVLIGHFLFGVPLQGNLIVLGLVILIGGFAFAGIGLLIASRAEKTETVSGLMNLVMLPMWLFSGIFFSSKRFPDVAQPFIQALPLTQLNEGLREVMLEGASLDQIAWRMGILIVWAIASFMLALKWFRWR